jgi:hypothetical protein
VFRHPYFRLPAILRTGKLAGQQSCHLLQIGINMMAI